MMWVSFRVFPRLSLARQVRFLGISGGGQQGFREAMGFPNGVGVSKRRWGFRGAMGFPGVDGVFREGRGFRETGFSQKGGFQTAGFRGTVFPAAAFRDRFSREISTEGDPDFMG